MGSDPIALPMLNCLCNEMSGQVELFAVFTKPDRRAGRGRQLQKNAIKSWALEHAIPIYQPEKPGPELPDWIRDQEIQLGLVLAYGHLLSVKILEAPKRGLWNFHGSLLPELRGASPLETAIAIGKRQTGMSLIRMVRKMDAGPLVDMETFPILENDCAPDLRQRGGKACVPLLKRNLADLLSGGATCRPQGEDGVSYCRRLERADGFLDFDQPAEVLERRFRACKPWPGSFFEYEEQRLKVGSLAVDGSVAGHGPGVLRIEDEQILISTSRGSLNILSLQRPGGNFLVAGDFLRGFEMKSGTQLVYPTSKAWVASVPFSP